MYWLLEQSALQRVRSIYESVDAAVIDRSAPLLAQQDLLNIQGNRAEVNIVGMLVDQPSIILSIFGIEHTTYRSLVSAFSEIAGSPQIRELILRVDSPGGEVHGLFKAFASLRAAADGKKVQVIADSAESAAYGLAAVSGGKIVPTNVGSSFGSIGVAGAVFLDPEVVDITSTGAEKKRPDVSTDEGRSVVREYLDQIHDEFVSAIAAGRSRATGKTITASQVTDSYGSGASLLARAALSAGLIDAKPTLTGARKKRAGVDRMEFDEYATANPEQARQALDQARDSARKEERERCLAHIELAEVSGDYQLVVEAVRSGAQFSASDATKHLQSASKKMLADARQKTTDHVDAITSGVTDGTTETRDVFDAVADAVGAPAEVK